MPAFSFEKIPAPPRIVTSAAAPEPRGRFARLVDRLAVLRLRSTAPRRAARPKSRKAKGA